MKSASTAVCTPQRSPPAAVGRVHRQYSSEVDSYLTKLRRMLPARPGARRLTKLEVIQSVIDYICDLQYCLQMPLDTADASIKAATESTPSAHESSDRTTMASGEHEPMLHEGDRIQLCTAAVEDEELEEEEDEEDDEAVDEEMAPTVAAAPRSSNDHSLPVSC